MKIAVCDDNKLFLAEFEEQLRGIPMVDTVVTFSDYNAFLFTIDEGKRYDVVFMDIEWDQPRSGMDIAAELYKLSPATKIIYVTGHSERFFEHIFLYKANLSGFLSKPIKAELLHANLQKAAEAIPLEDQSVLVLRKKGIPVTIPLREIFFIESRGHTVEVHTAEETIVSYEKLGAVMQALPAGFYRCHKSYIVNMNQIRRFQPADILLKNGDTVPVSRARYTQAKEAYFRYMGQMF